MGGKASIDFKPFDGFKISAIVAPRFNYDKFKTFKKAASYTLADDPNTIGGYLDNSGLYNTTKLSETRNDSYNVTTQLIANYAKRSLPENMTSTLWQVTKTITNILKN